MREYNEEVNYLLGVIKQSKQPCSVVFIPLLILRREIKC